MQRWLDSISSWLDAVIFQAGGTPITLRSLFTLLLLLILLFYLSGLLRRWLAFRLLTHTKLDLSARQAVASITRYLLLLVGFLAILQTVGINLTTLNVLAGAVGVGIGFGLQNIASNFISGLIIMFERPIKIGDRIEVSGVEGDVTEIGARSAKILTNDNITIIVPNSKFITENVVNWKYADTKVRFRVPITVASGNDLRQVEELLLAVARENRDVLKEPAPVVRFLKLDGTNLLFELRVWSTTLVHRKGALISALNFAIHDKFAEAGIEIPITQNELLMRSGTVLKSLPTADNARAEMAA